MQCSNPNVYLWSVVVDISFQSIVVIDWSVADGNEMGVEQLPNGNRKAPALGDFYDDMGIFLPERFNVNTLKSMLDFFGKDLREYDFD